MTDDDVKLPEPDFHAFNGPRYYTEPTVLRLIAEAVEREREACAVLCEDMAGFPDGEEMMSDRQWAAHTCAAAIRNRSKE